MDRLSKHKEAVSAIQREFQSHSASKWTIGKKKHASNTVRENSYRKKATPLNVYQLDQVLKIDPEKRIVTVEPFVTMEQLVDATLLHSLLPPVVPEFKSITVGGAINGTALESTSHLYGQFNDCCNAYEVLLGDGSIVRATREENADLFFGISGSYGTLGIILSVEIRLIEASPWSVIEYHDFISIEKAVDFMQKTHRSSQPPEYLEAIVLQKERTVVITGGQVFQQEEMDSLPRLSMGKSSDKWYYQVIGERFGSSCRKEAVRTKEYLFRQDRAGFWMGGYALHPLLLFRYVMEYFGLPAAWIGPKDITKYHDIPTPSWLFRFLFGWMMSSEKLYQIMHRGTEKWFADTFSIQDYYLPEEETASFTEYVIDKYRILPIWLCPMKGTTTQQFLSPHYLSNGGSELFFDIGVYGMAKDSIGGEAVVRDLDCLSVNKGGRKMLYSYSYYTEEEFWGIYSKKDYELLREKYHAKKAFPAITTKVL